MASQSPAYQWYPKDILASQRVAEMSAEVECWYRRALDFCWVNGSLPADPERCSRIIGKGCTEEGAQQVLEMFVFSRKDSTRKIHDRQEQERKKQAVNRRQKSTAGKASADKRKKTKELGEQREFNGRSTGVGTAEPTKFNSSSSSSSSSSEVVGGEEKTPPKPTPETGIKKPESDPLPPSHPAVVIYEEIFGSTSSQFAKAINLGVKNLGVWQSLILEKSSYPNPEKWIIGEYQKRVADAPSESRGEGRIKTAREFAEEAKQQMIDTAPQPQN